MAITLTSPTGTVVTLHNEEAGTGDDISVTYPDGRLPSLGAMTDFVGEEASGDWILDVVDGTVGNTGTVSGFSLRIALLSTANIRIGDRVVIESGSISGLASSPTVDSAASRQYVDDTVAASKFPGALLRHDSLNDLCSEVENVISPPDGATIALVYGYTGQNAGYCSMSGVLVGGMPESMIKCDQWSGSNANILRWSSCHRPAQPIIGDIFWYQ